MERLVRKLKRSTTNHFGIDIGAHSLKVVELRTAAGQTELAGSAVTVIAPGSQEAPVIAAQLRRTLREHGMQGRQAVASVSGPQVAVRRLRLPAIPEDEIAGAIRWHAGKSFPFSVDEASVAFQVLSRSGSGSRAMVELLVVAVMREAVMQKVEILQQAGLDCVGVVAEPHAWAQLWERTDLSGDEHGAHVVVDLGGSQTGIHIFQGGALQFARYISTSGNALSESLMGVMSAEDRQVTVDAEQAERLKQRHGIPEAGDSSATAEGIPLSSIGVRMRPILEKLVTEISRSVDYYVNQFQGAPIIRLLLAGGGSQLKNIKTAFSEWFDMEVEFLDPLACVVGKGRALASQAAASSPAVLAVATGLSLPIAPQFNLLPVDFRKKGDWNISAKMAYAAMGLLFLLPLGQYVWQAEQQIRATREAAAAKNRELEGFQAVLGQYEQLQLRKSQLDTDLAALPQIDPHAVRLALALQTVSRSMPDDMALTALEVKEAEQQGLLQIRMRGLIFGSEKESFSLLTRFMEQLERTSVFQGVEIGRSVTGEIPSPANLDFEILGYIH